MKCISIILLFHLFFITKTSAQSKTEMLKVYIKEEAPTAVIPRDSIHPTLEPILKKLLHPLHDHEVLNNSDLSIVKHPGYTSVMHDKFRIPAWVAHSINGPQLKAPGKYKREDNYPKDSLYPALKSDLYSSSGYDHGHLAPARDFKHDKAQYAESNNMTNMSPQYACFNQKGWCYLESLCREWAMEDSSSEMYIVSGPILNPNITADLFIDTLCIKEDLKVYVPHYFFKAICIYNKENHELKTIGFLVPNEDVDNAEIPLLKCSIDELEAISGLNFFSALPDKLENAAESVIPSMDFSYKSECGTKSCLTVYGKRIRPEKRIKLKCD